MDFHPVAELFPMLSEKDLADLAEDIKAHGQQLPILIDGSGRIYDGRNRFLACQLAEVAPIYKRKEELATVTEVVSLNLKRRQLTSSQRAQLMARLARRLEEDERIGTAPKPADSDKDSPVRNVAQPGAIKNADLPTNQELADAAEVSRRQLNHAKTVEESGTEEVKQAVEDGKLAVHKAAKIARLPKPKQADALAGQLAQERDELGTVLPEEIGLIFAKSDKIKTLMNDVRRLKSAINQVVDEPVGTYMVPNLQQAVADCENLYASLRFSMPYALCPHCSGDGCKACRDVGWMSKQIWEVSPK